MLGLDEKKPKKTKFVFVHYVSRGRDSVGDADYFVVVKSIQIGLQRGRVVIERQ